MPRRPPAGALALVLLCACAMVLAVAIDLAGRGDSPNPDPSPEGESVPASEPAARTPSDADPLRVLVAGDSLMGFIGPALEEWGAGRPVEVVDDWHGSSGLVRPDYFDWPTRLGETMALHDPEVVVFGLGANDTQDMATEGAVLTRDSPAWEMEYQRRVGEVLDAVDAPGRSMYWVGLPSTRRANIERIAPAIDRAVRAEIARRPWVHLVDARSILTPDGTFTDHLPDREGEPMRTLAPDGVHPTIDGARLIVAALGAEIAERRHLDG